jgi:hypothetical protein
MTEPAKVSGAYLGFGTSSDLLGQGRGRDLETQLVLGSRVGQVNLGPLKDHVVSVDFEGFGSFASDNTHGVGGRAIVGYSPSGGLWTLQAISESGVRIGSSGAEASATNKVAGKTSSASALLRTEGLSLGHAVGTGLELGIGNARVSFTAMYDLSDNVAEQTKLSADAGGDSARAETFAWGNETEGHATRLKVGGAIRWGF